MRSIETIFLPIGLLIFSAGLNQPRAGDSYKPAETEGPLGQPRAAARPAVANTGELHRNAFGKPCLEFAAASRAHLVDNRIFDYVVSVTNKCPRSIKIQICQKDRSGCSGAIAPAYRSKELVMGFGPLANTFKYIAKEAP